MVSREPFASQIRLAGLAKHFRFPYDRRRPTLLLIVTLRMSLLPAARHSGRRRAVVALNEKLSATRALDRRHQQIDRLDKTVANEALKKCHAGCAIHRSQTSLLPP